MDRVKRGTSVTISNVWYRDSVIIDPGTVTIGITRADGTTVVAAGTATGGGGAAARTFVLTTSHTALLDTLTATWTSSAEGTDSTVHEVAGEFLFTLTEFTPLLSGSAASATTAEKTEMRTTVEQEIEQACGVAFVPRYALDTVDGTGTQDIMLRPLVSRLRSVEVDGSAWAQSDLDAVSLGTTGKAHSAGSYWTSGSSNVVVGYEHGYSVPPPGVKRAALILAKMWLVGQRSPIDDRAATFSSTEGGTYSLVVPGRNGSHFGQPDVDAVIDRYSLVTGIA